MPNETAAPAQVTSLANLRKPLAPEQSMPAVRAGFNDLQGFELMQRQCKALAASTLVPQQFQGNMPNCLIALEMAQRIGASPLMVMQNLYIVHGRPGWSAKFLIASFNQCGRFSAIRFQFSGTEGKDDWGCRAYAIEKETGEKIQGPLITIGLAKKEKWYDKSGSKWQTIPELMLQYRAAAWMVNTHAPEISMGLNSAEELGDVFDASAGGDGTFTVTTEALRHPAAGSPVVEDDDPTQQIGAGSEGGAPVIDRPRIAAMIGAAKNDDDLDQALDLLGSSEISGKDQDDLRDEIAKARSKLKGGK